MEIQISIGGVEALFFSIAKAIAEFAQRHKLVLDKYYHDSPSWSLRFNHPKGGRVSISVLRGTEDHVKVYSVWHVDDYDHSTRSLHWRNAREVPKHESAIRDALREEFEAILSVRFGDWTHVADGYKRSWRRSRRLNSRQWGLTILTRSWKMTPNQSLKPTRYARSLALIRYSAAGARSDIRKFYSVLQLLVLLAVQAPALAKSAAVYGWGSHPISSELAALWLSGPENKEKPDPLAIAFFHGSAAWHEVEWAISAEIMQSPGKVELISGDMRLSLTVDVENDRVAVQGREFILSEANVVVVLNTGDSERVVPLGRFELTAAEESPAAIATLQKDPRLVEALTREIVGPDEIGERVARAMELGETPEGFTWRQLEAINAKLLIPLGWLFESAVEGGQLKYTVLPPSTLSQSGDARFTIMVHRRMTEENAVERAMEFVQEAVEGAVDAGEIEEHSAGRLRLFATLVKRGPKQVGGSAQVLSVSAAGNVETNTLYTMAFEVPEEEWSRVWAAGRFLAGTFTLDDEQ